MKYEKEYFVNSGTSNYIDYREKKYFELAKDLIKEVPLSKNNKILDFGAATGALIYELKKQDISDVTGTDISYWAITQGRKQFNLDHTILQHYNRQLLENNFDIILLLDVLEHISDDELHEVLSLIKANILTLRCPVSAKEGHNYILDISKNDKTHIQVHTKNWWCCLLKKYNYESVKILNAKTIYESDGVLSRIFKRI